MRLQRQIMKMLLEKMAIVIAVRVEALPVGCLNLDKTSEVFRRQ